MPRFSTIIYQTLSQICHLSKQIKISRKNTLQMSNKKLGVDYKSESKGIEFLSQTLIF